jgi:ribose/xylose/arabinose/galactoside ABC-type transport system permease subunit
MDATLAPNRRNVLASALRRKETAILLALVILTLVFTVIVDLGALLGDGRVRFFTRDNASQVARQISFVAIVAIGELFVILHGGIDLSVGSVMGWSGMAAAWGMAGLGFPLPAAVAFGIFAGLLMGAINGALIAWVKLPPFIVTLSMLWFAYSNVLGLTDGNPITQLPRSFVQFAWGKTLGLPNPVWIAVILAVAAHVLLTYTAFGRRTYALGGNEQATFLSGIDVNRIKFTLYVISAGLAAVSGILLASRFNSAQPDTGKGWELNAIAAAVIGGTSLAGGSGTVLGVLIGACIMGVLGNGLLMMGVRSHWHQSIIAVAIVLAAVLDVKTKKGK